MLNKICFAYHWATSGGVERVFLNRGEALLGQYPKLEIEVYFNYDCGGGALIQRYSKSRGLSDRLRVVRQFDPSRYEIVFVIDTPQLLTDYPAVADKMLICGSHFPWAGFGRLARDGAHYALDLLPA